MRPRRSFVFWPFIIGGVALVGVLVLFLALRDDPNTLVASPPKGATEGAYGGAITDLSEIIGRAQRLELVDREVALQGVKVLEVKGDRAFFIGTGETTKLPVVLAVNAPAARTSDRAAATLGVGDVVALHGTVKRIPKNAAQRAALQLENGRPTDVERMQVMIVASDVVQTWTREQKATPR